MGIAHAKRSGTAAAARGLTVARACGAAAFGRQPELT